MAGTIIPLQPIPHKYVGGEIIKQYRGNYAVLIMHDNMVDPAVKGYSVFLEESGSDNFEYLTGPKRVSYILDRAYAGVSIERGTEILQMVDEWGKDLKLKTIDSLLVNPQFIEKDITISIESE
jgi:hypothetical protein